MAGEAASPSHSGMKFSLRACCSDAPAGVGFVEKADGAPVLATGDVVLPVVEPGPRSREDAFHEASHAAAAFVFGVPVAEVTIEPPNPMVRYREGPAGFARVIVSLAGPAGGLLSYRREHREHDVVVAETYRRAVRWPGRCDACSAMRECALLARLDEAKAVSIYRAAEAAAWRLLAEPPMRRLIRIAAERLLQEGIIQGEDFHALAAEIVDRETLETLRSLITKENTNA